MTNTSQLGLFKIISESSVAAGVRRIEGTTGRGVLGLIQKDKNLIHETAKILKINNPGEIAKKAEILQNEIKEQKREIESLTAEIARNKTKELASNIKKVGGIDYLAVISDEISPDEAKVICEELRQKNPNIAAVIASTFENRLTFTAVCGSEAVKCGANAGSLAKQIAQFAGGGGGGRPESAVAGGRDLSKAGEAISKGEEILKSMLK